MYRLIKKIDCEYQRGKKQVSLIQIGHQRMVLLIRMHLLSSIPNELRRFCCDNDILKCGVGLEQDATLLKKSNIIVAGCVELNNHTDSNETLSLDELALSVLSRPMQFKQIINHWEWESEYLDDVQVGYAADDAIVGYLVYQTLQNRYDAYLGLPASHHHHQQNEKKEKERTLPPVLADTFGATQSYQQYLKFHDEAREIYLEKKLKSKAEESQDELNDFLFPILRNMYAHQKGDRIGAVDDGFESCVESDPLVTRKAKRQFLRNNCGHYGVDYSIEDRKKKENQTIIINIKQRRDANNLFTLNWKMEKKQSPYFANRNRF